jgi:hypothetical protein
MSKAVVLSVSKGSGGYVAARGSLTLQSKTYGAQTALGDSPAGSVISASTGAISGGTTDLTVLDERRHYSGGRPK